MCRSSKGVQDTVGFVDQIRDRMVLFFGGFQLSKIVPQDRGSSRHEQMRNTSAVCFYRSFLLSAPWNALFHKLL